MPETRAISDRINLAYVKRKHWPQTSMFKLSVLVGGAVLLGALVLEAGHRTGTFAGDRFYNSGAVTHAHSMFGNNCAACHVADPLNPDKVAFNLPVQDDKCLDCHKTHAATHAKDVSKYAGKDWMVKGLSDPVRMASGCAECHVEHQGYDYNLNRVADMVCTQCHADIQKDGYAAGKAPATQRIANVTAFSAPGGHPGWEKKDEADYLFGHMKHLSPDGYPGMQRALLAIKEGKSPSGGTTKRARHIEDAKSDRGVSIVGKDGKPMLGMSCTYCHEVDSDGAYMKPVDFETHCVDCHTGALGVVGAKGNEDEIFKVIGSEITSDDAKELVRPAAIPHGSSSQVAELVERAIAQFIADNPPQFKAADAAKPAGEGEAKPAEESGGRRRRGGGAEEAKPAEAAPAEEKPADEGGGRRRRGGAAEEAKPAEGEQPAGRRRGGSGGAAPAGPTAKIPDSAAASNEALKAWVASERKRVMSDIQTSCSKCHTNIKPGPEATPEFFGISDKKIPDRWLTKSHFGHAAHAMIDCRSCHAAPQSGNTSDVLMPKVESCRECHAKGATPSGSSAPFDCVLCHSFHQHLPASVEGSKTIEQVRQGGIATLKAAAQAAGAEPAKPAGGAAPAEAKPAESKPAGQ